MSVVPLTTGEGKLDPVAVTCAVARSAIARLSAATEIPVRTER